MHVGLLVCFLSTRIDLVHIFTCDTDTPSDCISNIEQESLHTQTRLLQPPHKDVNILNWFLTGICSMLFSVLAVMPKPYLFQQSAILCPVISQ